MSELYLADLFAGGGGFSTGIAEACQHGSQDSYGLGEGGAGVMSGTVQSNRAVHIEEYRISEQ